VTPADAAAPAAPSGQPTGDPPFALPTLVVLTDGSLTGGRPLMGVLRAVVEGGARAVLVREKHLPVRQRAELAAELAALLHPLGGIVLVASDPTIPSDGVHLAGSDPVPDPPPPRWGRSCHDAGEVAEAARNGSSWATLSPVFPSRSKPGYGPPLGPAALAGHPLPVLALGGVDASNAADCVRAGAAGVAVMGALMAAPDPAAATAALCRTLGQR
jgi:thiamine-phosphate pyrophosphorylase